jgi:hypothetical protein
MRSVTIKKQTKKVKREGRRGEKGGNRRKRGEKFEKGKRGKEEFFWTCFIHFKLQIISFLDFLSQVLTRFLLHMFLLKLETSWQW